MYNSSLAGLLSMVLLGCLVRIYCKVWRQEDSQFLLLSGKMLSNMILIRI